MSGDASYKFFVGDIHNHCGVSYGHGTAEQAFATAETQLDFVSVTGHAWWHDIPRTDEPELKAALDAHVDGFEKLARGWDEFLALTDGRNVDGRFVTFASFEWHSIRHGDRCVYYRDCNGPIIRAGSLSELHDRIRSLRASGVATMAIPHHTAYGRGNRGLLWEELDESINPVVEIVSMHGCADVEVADRPYLLPIGPRSYGGSLQEGLRSGKRFGVIGSTDHHAASPGAYGFGRIGVWATELTRAAVWDAIVNRRVVGLTGDRTEVALNVDGTPMGATAVYAAHRAIECTVSGAVPIERIDIVRDGAEWYTESIGRPVHGSPFVVPIQIGWGRPGAIQEWDLQISTDRATIEDVTSRFRGDTVVNPAQDNVEELRRPARWQRLDSRRIALTLNTRGNQSSVQDDTQGLVLRIAGAADAVLTIRDQHTGQSIAVSIDDLRVGPATWNPFGYIGAAIQIQPPISADQCAQAIRIVDDENDGLPHNYLARVKIANGQWAWSSPVWVSGNGS